MPDKIEMTFEELAEYTESLEDDYDFVFRELQSFKKAAKELGCLEEIQSLMEKE